MKSFLNALIIFTVVSNFNFAFAQSSDATATGSDRLGLYEKLSMHHDFPKLSSAHLGSSNSADLNSYSVGLLGSVDGKMTRIMNGLPESSLKRGIKKYLEIVNAQEYQGDGSVGGSNKGLSAYQSNTIKSNPCFARLAKDFFKEINDIDLQLIAEHEDEIEQDPLKGRASLSTETGKGIYKNLTPGWLINKGLSFTDGDYNLALSMIGFCGHDDVKQGHFTFLDPLSNQVPIDREEYLTALDSKISQLKSAQQSMQETTTNEAADLRLLDIELLQMFRARLAKGEVNTRFVDSGSVTRMRCPRRSSVMFLSKALGKKVDLSDSYKNRVAGIQAPTKGRGYLPAKNYHMMGAAFMTCSLIQEGIAPKIAEFIQKLAAWTYRTIRMNDVLSERFQDDATKVLGRMVLGGGTFGKSLPYSNISLNFLGDPVTRHLKLSDGRRQNKIISVINRETVPKGWTQERFDTAKLKALTYLIDWEWTVKQHEIGAEFAAKNCKRKPARYRPDQNACHILDRRVTAITGKTPRLVDSLLILPRTSSEPSEDVPDSNITTTVMPDNTLVIQGLY